MFRMKKIISYTLLVLFSFSMAQKMAYVDTQYILKQMPQYQQSEQRLNAEVKKWQDEIIKQQSAIEKLRVEFENEKVLLTDDQQKTKLAVIDSTENVSHEFIEKKFGTNGESISLRLNLVKPLQDQIWNAINTVVAKDKYNIVFDKSSDLIMVFTDSRYDITDKVLKQLGVDTKGREEEGTKSTRAKASATSSKSRENTSASTKREETDTNKSKPKSGYGSKYTPKKEEVKTEDKAETKETEKTETEANASQPQSGYGSKYTPKKEEIKTEDKAKTEETKKTETKTTTSQPKSGYGSKYVPKKNTNKAETKESTTNK
jgi:outer membrane protein